MHKSLAVAHTLCKCECIMPMLMLGHDTLRGQNGRRYKYCHGGLQESISSLVCPFFSLQPCGLSLKPSVWPRLRRHHSIEMCRFYAHTYQCGHTKTVLSNHCSRAALIQRACRNGDICANVQVDEKCSSCHKPVKILVQARILDHGFKSMSS